MSADNFAIMCYIDNIPNYVLSVKDASTVYTGASIYSLRLSKKEAKEKADELTKLSNVNHYIKFIL